MTLRISRPQSSWWSSHNWLARFGVLIIGVSVGCSQQDTDRSLNGEPPTIPVDDPAALSCHDKDGDGFGIGCGNGADCDDEHASITAECYSCAGNPTGCPCSKEGQRIACGELSHDANGAPGCLMGEKVCAAGKWSACQSDGAGLQALRTPLSPLGLGGAANSCANNPCDPYCQHFPDTPDPGLTNDSGILGTDAGLQLVPTPVDAGPPQECINETAEAQPLPLDIYIMLDKSGSMGGTRWTSVKAAINSFVQAPESAGISVALDYFPDGTSTQWCTVSRYETPSVAWSLLPGGAAAITASMNANTPAGNTPTRPALQGALTYARAREVAFPGNKAVVVLATDGNPTDCTSNTIFNVRDQAAAGLAGTPSIETYVIGVGTAVSNLDLVAAAGGSGSAYMVTSGSSASFLAAMNDIRQKALGCDYSLPPNPSTGNIDPNATEVSYQYGSSGTPTDLSVYPNQTACGTNDGFYYDNPTNPTKLTLCPKTCTTVGSNANYKVNLTFLCKANCGSSESGIEPVPLDLYVMLDKSGSMNWDSPTRWSAVTSALKTFVDSSSAAGITMGLDYFPLPEAYPDQCTLGHYTTPSVAWTLLPGGSTSVKNSLNATSPYGGTPTLPALTGAIQYARNRAVAMPTNKVAVVLATDGEPNNCNSTIASVAQAAAEGFAGGSTVTTATVTQVSETYENITTTGTRAFATGDDRTRGPFNIGFTYGYYGQNFTQFYVNTNGFIALGSYPPDGAWANYGLPDTADPNGMIAALWDDLIVDGDIYYRTTGTAPNRRLIVMYTSVRHYGYTGNMNFEIVLHEGGDVSLRYGSMTGAYADGSSATIGVENAAGTDGHQYSYNSAVITSNMTLRYHWSTTASTWPSIPTYVIGVGYATGMNTIAAAGGTGAAFIVSGGNTSQFLAAMNAIRMQALGCQYNIPPSTLGTVDPSTLVVRYTAGGTGTIQDLPLRSGAGSCGSTHGFYYDNPANPTTLTLCPASCTLVGGDTEAQLNIFYDCMGNYPDGVFIRDYSAEGLCPPGSSHIWTFWTWDAETPSNSSIDFTVSVSDTLAGLVTAPQYPLKFTDPPGPSALVGSSIGARAGTPDTQTGSAKVDTTLAPYGPERKKPFLRVRSLLRASTPNAAETPLLKNWDMAISCEASE